MVVSGRRSRRAMWCAGWQTYYQRQRMALIRCRLALKVSLPTLANLLRFGRRTLVDNRTGRAVIPLAGLNGRLGGQANNGANVLARRGRFHFRLDRGLLGAGGGATSGSSCRMPMYTGKRGTPPSVNSW